VPPQFPTHIGLCIVGFVRTVDVVVTRPCRAAEEEANEGDGHATFSSCGTRLTAGRVLSRQQVDDGPFHSSQATTSTTADTHRSKSLGITLNTLCGSMV